MTKEASSVEVPVSSHRNDVSVLGNIFFILKRSHDCILNVHYRYDVVVSILVTLL